MKLYIKDRIYLLGLLPQKAINYKTYQLKKQLVSILQLNDDDWKKYGIRQDENSGDVGWDMEVDKNNPLELNITEDMAKYLHGVCEDVSDNDYTDDVWQLIERIFDECSPLINEDKH